MQKSTAIPEDLSRVARETKALVALAFLNGPIENVHGGKACPMPRQPRSFLITHGEMLQIMKAVVDRGCDEMNLSGGGLNLVARTGVERPECHSS